MHAGKVAAAAAAARGGTAGGIRGMSGGDPPAPRLDVGCCRLVHSSRASLQGDEFNVFLKQMLQSPFARPSYEHLCAA